MEPYRHCLGLLIFCAISAIPQLFQEIKGEELGKCNVRAGEGTLISISTPSHHPLYYVCHNKFWGNTLWTRHLVSKDGMKIPTNGREPKESWSIIPIPNVKNEYFEKIAIGVSYTIKHQKERFKQLFDNNEYIKDQLYFLAKGHLTPNADFGGADEREATFYYVNAHPQWQIINQGNWFKVETLVRKMANMTSVPLTVYTGTYDILKLPTVGPDPPEEKAIWLGKLKGKYTNCDEKQLPVNKFSWKIVLLGGDQNPTDGVVFVTINNPYIRNVIVGPADDIFCEDVCNNEELGTDLAGRFSLSEDDRHNYEKGYTFCCTVEDFTNRVWHAPQFDNRNIGLLYTSKLPPLPTSTPPPRTKRPRPIENEFEEIEL